MSGDDLRIGADIGLLCDAVEVAFRYRYANQSLMQRRVRVGFVKAGRLLILLTGYGIVGQPEGRSQRRPVLITDLAATQNWLRHVAAEQESR